MGILDKVLDEIPGHAAMAQHIAGLMGKDLLRYDFSRRGDRLFYRTMQPGSNLPKLAYRDGVNGEESSGGSGEAAHGHRAPILRSIGIPRRGTAAMWPMEFHPTMPESRACETFGTLVGI